MAERNGASPPSAARRALIDQLNRVVREHGAATVRSQSALAERHGLSAADMRTLQLLMAKGSLTHSQLCQATGLSKPSVSDRIDRLERKGYAIRKRRPGDKRRVTVVPNREQVVDQLGSLFGSEASLDVEFCSRYSNEQLEAIADFLYRVARAHGRMAHALGSVDAKDAKVDPIPPPRPKRHPRERKQTFAERFLGH